MGEDRKRWDHGARLRESLALPHDGDHGTILEEELTSAATPFLHLLASLTIAAAIYLFYSML